MNTFKRILKIILGALLIVVFPLGIIYLIFRTMAKDFGCFLASILLFGIGFAVAYFIYHPEQWQTIVDYVNNIFNFC